MHLPGTRVLVCPVKLTKRGEYALRTLIQLGIAAQLGRDVVSVSQLAEIERLPFKFIENILQELRRHGYVESKRGKDGGARLAKAPSEITIGEVVRLIDGRLAPIGCASETDYECCSCPDEQHCGLRMLMIDVRNAIARILDKYTLLDVVDVTLKKMEQSGLSSSLMAAKASGSGRKLAPTKPEAVLHANPLDGFLAMLNPVGPKTPPKS